MNTTVKVLEDHILVTVTYVREEDKNLTSLLSEIFAGVKVEIENHEEDPELVGKWTECKIKKYSYLNIKKTLGEVIAELNKYGFHPLLEPVSY